MSPTSHIDRRLAALAALARTGAIRRLRQDVPFETIEVSTGRVMWTERAAFVYEVAGRTLVESAHGVVCGPCDVGPFKYETREIVSGAPAAGQLELF